MNYKREVVKYGKSLNNFQKEQLKTIIKKSIDDGLDYQWIYTALNHKTKEQWEKYGYGLFLNKSFRTQIKRKLQKESQDPESDNFWDDLPDV